MANFRVLVSDPLAEEGLAILKKACDVDVKTDLKEDELLQDHRRLRCPAGEERY